MKNKNTGITLISLVVTIVVLLILAGISLSLILGNNGIITKSKEASDKTTISSEKESITLAYNACQIGEDPTRAITATELQQELTNQGKDIEVISLGSSLSVTYKNTEHNYVINQDGKVLTSEEAQGQNVIDYGTTADYCIYKYYSNKRCKIFNPNNKKIAYAQWTEFEDNIEKQVNAVSFIKNTITDFPAGFIDDNNKLNLLSYDESNLCIDDEKLKNDKIKYINEGEYLVTEKGNVYKPIQSDGNTFILEENEYTAKEKNTPFYNKIKKYAKYAFNIAAYYLSEDGKIYSYDDKFTSQQTNTNQEYACLNDLENDLKGKFITDIYIKDSKFAVDSDGKVYSWGDNDCGQLGNGNNTNTINPICISNIEGSALNNKKIVQIYNNQKCTYAIDVEGKVYAWGKNEKGQLGNGSNENINIPICISDIDNDIKGKKIIKLLETPYTISEIPCTVLGLDDKGNVYTWGANNNGCLGIGNYNQDYCLNTPTCINTVNNSELNNKKIVDIEMTESVEGYTGYIAVDENGYIYVWGHYSEGNNEEEVKNYYLPICITNDTNSKLYNVKGKSLNREKEYLLLLTEDNNIFIKMLGKME